MNLTLYKDLNFDGVGSFPHIVSKSSFDTYLEGKEQYSQPVNYNRIGDPILLNLSYDDAVEYGYGCIETDDKKYFIIPDSVTVNENNRVYLTYTVDWYTSLKYDNNISFGRAHLIKSSGVDPLTYQQGIQPIDMRILSVDPFDTTAELGTITSNNMGDIYVAYTTSDQSSKVRWVLSRVRNGYKAYHNMVQAIEAGGTAPSVETSGYSIGVPEIMDGFLYTACGIQPSNIVGIYYVPYPGANTVLDDLYHGKFKLIGSNKYIWYELDTDYSAPYFNLEYKDFNLTCTATESVHLIDRYGGIIYSVPYGRTLKRIVYKPIMTASSCYIALEFVYEDNTAPNLWDSLLVEKSAENSFMLYMCERIDYNNDAYANWAAGLKGVEIEERRMQKNKALVSNLSGTAVTTAIGAGTAGPVGAAVGAIGSITSAFASYGIETYYENDVNRLEDRKYQLAQDTMVPGGFLPGLYPTLAVVTLSASPSDIARYNSEISNFGADCNLPVSNWIPAPGAYKFADVEVIADTPYSIKQGIRQKLLSGIKIVDVM